MLFMAGSLEIISINLIEKISWSPFVNQNYNALVFSLEISQLNIVITNLIKVKLTSVHLYKDLLVKNLNFYIKN